MSRCGQHLSAGRCHLQGQDDVRREHACGRVEIRQAEQHPDQKVVQRFLAPLLIALLVLLGACSPLPDYARPRLQGQANLAADQQEGFTYRQLSRSDFQAAALPPEQAGNSRRFSAFSCLRIHPASDSRFLIQEVAYQRQIFYVGTIDHLAFDAQSVPHCSWWNPATPAQRQDYVLEHEQIHFALAELAARRLGRQMAGHLQAYHAMEQSPEAVMEALMQMVSGQVQHAMKENLERQTDLDEQTSAFYDPEAQRHWLRDIELQLLSFERPREAQ